jgi:anti-sigma factor RsiW
MKTCGFENQINPYLDGELSDAKLSAFEAHLQACPQCREEVEQYRGMLDSLHGIGDREVPPMLQDRLHAALPMKFRKGMAG